MLFQGKYDVHFNLISPTYKSWFVDPFVVSIENNNYIFVEEYNRIKKISHLSAINILTNKKKKILSENFHLSFPNIFKVNDSFYMIPETSNNSSILIYQMTSDIFHWNKIAQYDIAKIVDTSVYYTNNSLYLSCSEESISEKLKTRNRLFVISNFPYSLNLVNISKNIEKQQFDYISRNGGALIKNGDELYRVVQVSDSSSYGINLSINRVISDKTLKEEKLLDIYPSNLKFNQQKLDILGFHIYNFNEYYEVIDLHCGFYSFKNIFTKIARFLYKKP